MKKRLLSLALCLCMSAVFVTGCSSEDKTEDTNKNKTEENGLIDVNDDNAEALHKILMERTGNAALEHAKISDYSSLQLEVEDEIVVTDELFQEELDYLLEEYPFAFSGQAVSGDTVNIDFVGYIDGTEFEGGAATGADVLLEGTGGMIPGFVDQIVGMNVGETKMIDVTFPEEYKDSNGNIIEEVAGKPAQFKITLNYMQKGDGTIPELTEQWVAAYLKAVGGTVTDASVEGFKSYYRSYLEDSAKQIRKNNVDTALERKLIDLVELKDVPEDQMTYYGEMVKTGIENDITSSYNMSMDSYLEYIGMSDEEYAERLEEITEETIKGRYAVICIGEKEGLLPTEEEYTALLQSYADNYAITLDEFRSTYQEAYQLDIYFEAYTNKVMEKLLEKAVITAPAGDEASGGAVAAE